MSASNAANNPLGQAVLRALIYFDIFAYPLTADEIWAYLPEWGHAKNDLQAALEDLESQGLVFRFEEFYQIQDDATWRARRRELNQRAEQFLPVAWRMARLISAFPFIRCVAVSGSLSKQCMSADGDIDFFLITTPGRLWLARTLLAFFKKIFLLNSHKYFCINYFVDTEHLEIEEKNLFTATEIVTLLPMFGGEIFERFQAANTWAWRELPHCTPKNTSPTPPIPFGKRALEGLLAGQIGEWLDRQSMHLTVAFWRRKFRHFDANTFDHALKSRRYVSKHHPFYFQKKVLDGYAARQKALAQRMASSMSIGKNSSNRQP